MGTIKIKAYGLLAIMSLSILGSSFAASVVSATSPYDDAIQVASTATLVSPNTSQTKNISNSWLSEMLSATDYSAVGSTCSGAVSEIQSLNYALGHTLGVSTFNYDGLNARGVYIYWQTSGGQIGVNDTGTKHQAMAYDGANVTSGSGGSGNGGSAFLWIENTGNINAACDLTAYQLSQNVISDNAANGTKIYFTNWPVNKPSGYSGLTVPSSTPGGIISGNVQCIHANAITNVLINAQSGPDGNAVISNDGNGGVNYYFNLVEASDYSLIVLCNGSSFYGPTVNSGYYDSYNWYCAAVEGPDGCAAG